MYRRDFLRSGLAAGAACMIPEATGSFKTRHLIWIINGNGSRKKDWYETPSLCPNFARLVREGFVYEESFNETVSRHAESFNELITGSPAPPVSDSRPTVLQYVQAAYGDPASKYWLMKGGRDLIHACGSTAELSSVEKRQLAEFGKTIAESTNSVFELKHPPLSREPFISDARGLAMIPEIMKVFKPRMLLFHQTGHDAAHGNGGYPREQTGYSEYQQVCRTTDEQIGKIFDFVKADPYFSRNTTILVRPEFGRDDEITRYGEIHHSTGFYQSHYSAEFWWGPDIRPGLEKALKNRLDIAPTLTRIFNVDAPFALGQAHTEMFENTGTFSSCLPPTW